MIMTREEILEKAKILNEADDYDALIVLLGRAYDESANDYVYGLELSRAFINKGNSVDEGFPFYVKANALLDNCALSGKDDPVWLYRKAYALYKLNLVEDAIIRLERAARFVDINSPISLLTINNLLLVCKKLEEKMKLKKLSSEDRQAFFTHINKHFGKSKLLFNADGVEFYEIEASEQHDYKMIVSLGVSALSMPVPQGFSEKENSKTELCVILPKKWEMNLNEERLSWPLKVLSSLCNYVLTEKAFVGFGFSFDNGKPFSSHTKFQGAMLTALGDYPKEAQNYQVADGFQVNLFQMVPLLPMEVAYRLNHSAQDLLNLFKLRHVALTPLFEGRPDVCESLTVKKV
ncbi:hypothetical protein HMPREF9444_01624 [Succinatimonas hippei YIT 12066]|uniref:Suppressor of fused-like domain-containing protein n=2 Tax=Succinatimonas TaxID=674963 RepID=E8LLK7_SUCHY|nr:hypothetical protein HMPREF9444_01624 [Succinatimonas hippei YIT 12066]